MAAVNLELKEYQKAALGRFASYLRDSVNHGCDIAFYKATRLPYRNAPEIAEGTPYVCLRVPTGGGKTLMGAHAVGIAAQEYLQAANPMVLWLVPSNPILEQTVAALKNLDHPYRAALAKDFGRNVTILTKAEALAMSRADATGGGRHRATASRDPPARHVRPRQPLAVLQGTDDEGEPQPAPARLCKVAECREGDRPALREIEQHPDFGRRR